jgi:PKD repeat protein
MKAIYAVLVLLLCAAGVQAAAGVEIYYYITQWGSEGTGTGQFGAMTGIAADSLGNVYTTEQNGPEHPAPSPDSSRVQRFTANGVFIKSWTMTNGDAENYAFVPDIDADSLGYVYTPETVLDDQFGLVFRGIRKYDSDGVLVRQWSSDSPGGQEGVAVSAAGNVYSLWRFLNVSQDFYGVRVWAPTGEFLREWSHPGTNFEIPVSIAVDPAGYVYIVDETTSCVQKYTATGYLLDRWGGYGAGDGQFNWPHGICVDSNGDVYVSDTWNHRVQKFHSNGTFVTKWGTEGSGNGQFESPNGVDVDSDGNVYVLDPGNHRVQRFSPYLQPDFSATPRFGTAPLTVQFTDHTTCGQPLTWHWDFGDGGTSQLTNPVHTYTEPGRYDVSLTVSNAISGSRTKTQAHFVLVTEPLIANFTASPRIGYAPLSVQFTDQTTGDPTGWAWYFGDDTVAPSTLQNPHHTYVDPGTYRVTLVASKTGGNNTTSRYNYIHVLPLTGPFRIEAEDYDEGGEGVAYHDESSTNEGGAYRQDGVDVSTFERGYVVSHIWDGEWTQYTIPSAAATDHNYTLTLHASTRTTGEYVKVEVRDSQILGSKEEVVVDLPNTGSLSEYTNVTTTLRLHPGTNTVRFTYYGAYTNVDYFVLDPRKIDPVQAVGGSLYPPNDLHLDGLYEDVNGNGRADFNDVVLYFNQMTWIAANEPLAAFDYNGNGRIDFADIVWLFNNL